MTVKTTASVAIPVVLAFGLLGAGRALSEQRRQPTYRTSVQTTDRISGLEREERRERHGASAEAARLTPLAKVDMDQATAAALAQVPGRALGASLDDENGNAVYSVEVQTAGGQVKNVKVDASTGVVLHVGAAAAGDKDDEDD